MWSLRLLDLKGARGGEGKVHVPKEGMPEVANARPRALGWGAVETWQTARIM